MTPYRRPLAIDLFCGLGGWTEGLLSEGFDVVGFDIEAHEYEGERYPATLVVQDVLTLHGSQFKDAALIVASPPCQEYSYMAMPWTRAKAKAAAIRADKTGAELERLNRLFNASFRIQREASEAAGRWIPMVVENVRGAQPWVGPAKWNFGSYYLWGDVPALMPQPQRAAHKAPGGGHIRNGAAHTSRLTAPAEGRKGAGAGAEWFDGNLCQLPSGSKRRKAASAQIAKIPLALSSWIARHYRPENESGPNSGIEPDRLSEWPEKMARVTGLEPAASGVTGRRSNQLSYTRAGHRQ
jgi:hypothetical protein